MEAAFGALLVAQMVEMRVALARQGKRIDAVESTTCRPAIVRVALAFACGSAFYLAASHH